MKIHKYKILFCKDEFKGNFNIPFCYCQKSITEETRSLRWKKVTCKDCLKKKGK